MSERMSDIRHFAKVGARVVANAQGADLDEEAFLELYDDALAAHDAEKRAEWEAEQGKPDPCVMTHTPPFDFAQCETHDETFPLGGSCKWHGKESIAEVLQDEADAQRRRAVRAEHELEMLRAEQGETEWEYGWVGVDEAGDEWVAEMEFGSRAEAESFEKGRGWIRRQGGSLHRRRKPGDWLPVPDTTKEVG